MVENYVVDSSVLVKWFIDEKYSDKAIKLRDDFIQGEIVLHSPDLIYYEVISAMRHSSLFDINELKDASNSLIDYQLNIYHWDREISNRAISMADETNTTIYDMYFLALAEKLEYQYLTADDKFETKVRVSNAHKWIKHIQLYG